MSEPREDLEGRVAAALREGSHGAPDAFGLADAARRRAGQRRRTRIAGVSAVVALAVAGPVAVVAWPDSGSGGDRDLADTASEGPASDSGRRWESWHGVTVQVPDTWGYGGLGDWCADGGQVGTPRVQRPGTLSSAILCDPESTYGLTFQEIDNHDDFEWPVVSQTGKGWPQPNAVGGRGIGGVLVTVSAPDDETAHQVLDSMRAIPATGDPNGCPARLTPGKATPREGGLAVCRYDETWALDQSEVLLGQEAGDAVRALQDAPGATECGAAGRGAQPHQVITMEAPGITARIDLVEGCARMQVDGQVRDLTTAVLYWALSPGWSGAVDGDVPLPGTLRQG
jgi:hypothetical protein